jgi:two-component system, OmpR family, KDP operon response regulator KdpE
MPDALPALKKILVVDDDPDFRHAIYVRLKSSYDTIFAGDGVSAIAEAHAHQPDLIMLDLGLPGQDGFAVMEALQANPRLARIPVVVVSARHTPGNRERSMHAGAKGYITKPPDIAELLAVLRKALSTA